jgi:4-amino-4-deoxy-L-arabinose transferase-like glycosyltransferase
MSDSRAGARRALAVLALASLTLGVGLGSSSRLTYHEAFVAQAAREMIASGDVVIPTIGGRPWLEKPPLAFWLAALAGKATGGVSEAAARAPSALAAVLLALAVAALAARRFGSSAGLLAGLIQITTAWTVLRGRLAEVDVTLACLVAWSVVAFDHLRSTGEENEAESSMRWRWAFFGLLGLTALAKGVGFGAVLVLAVAALVIAWDRDLAAFRRLRWARGWALAAVLGLTWPLLATLRQPSAVGLWFLHVSDRLAAEPKVFTSQSWWQYVLTVATMLLPWLPLAFGGAWRSLPRACLRGGRYGGDRLLWAWTVAPLALLSLATVKNAHYAIHALPPCSVWAALGLLKLGARLQATRGWSVSRVRRAAWGGFVGLGLAYAVGFVWLGPRLDRRGVEWAFYEQAARRLRPGEPVALMYHVPEWDRNPYESPFGPFPHDWAVRLYYLEHPAPCRFSLDDLALSPIAPAESSFAVLGRESDRDGLSRFGRVETLAEGPAVRSDRTYRLFRVTPAASAIASAPGVVPPRR